MPATPTLASASERTGAYILDALMITVVAIALFYLAMPWRAYTGFATVAFVLFRDITGQSPGKRILGLRVLRLDGSAPAVWALVLRNVTLAFGPLASEFMPHSRMSKVLQIIVLVEIAAVWSTRRRIGDHLAGTVVCETNDNAL